MTSPIPPLPIRRADPITLRDQRMLRRIGSVAALIFFAGDRDLDGGRFGLAGHDLEVYRGELDYGVTEDEGSTHRWQRLPRTDVTVDPIAQMRSAIGEIKKAPRDPEARRRLRALAADQGAWEQLALLLADEVRASGKRPTSRPRSSKSWPTSTRTSISRSRRSTRWKRSSSSS